MSQRNKEIVEQVNAAFAAGSTEGFLSFCAEDVEWVMVGDRAVKGRDSVREWMGSMDAETPTFTVDNMIAEGDFVTAYGDMTMTDKDGKVAAYSYCDIYRFRDGKIVQLTVFIVATEAKPEAGNEI